MSKVLVALKMKAKSNSELIENADHYTGIMTGNATFAAADIVAQVTLTKTAITSLRNAINAVISENKTDLINISRDVLERNLTKLAGKVEDLANDPTTPDINRENVVHAAGMELRTRTIPKKRIFTAENTPISGSVVLVAQGGANAHEWQYTTDTDNYTNRIAAKTTTGGKVTIPGLSKATEYAFFHKPIKANEELDWEGPVFLVVT